MFTFLDLRWLLDPLVFYLRGDLGGLSLCRNVYETKIESLWVQLEEKNTPKTVFFVMKKN